MAIFDHFLAFLPKPDFLKKIPHIIPQRALIPCQISQKLMCKFQEKLNFWKERKLDRKMVQRDGQNEGWEARLKNRQTLIWLVWLKLIQLEQQKTQLPFIILAKNLRPILCRVIKGT